LERQGNGTTTKNILRKTGTLLSEKLRDADIMIHNYQLITIREKAHNYFFNTEIGAFLIKGEKHFWYQAGRDSKTFREPTVTINIGVYNEWIEKYKATFLYHCEPYGNVVKYLDYDIMNKRAKGDTQPFNDEVVVGFPERIFRQWLPKREYIHYF
jgi:hypothetical protein